MNKLYRQFKDSEGGITRIYTDGNGHFAKIIKVCEWYSIFPCDKYGCVESAYHLIECTLSKAKDTMNKRILNYYN